MKNIEITNIKLSKKSKAAIRKWLRENKRTGNEDHAPTCKDPIVDIECGRWHGPVPSYDYADIKECWENGFHEFFDIPMSVLIEIDSLDTGILSFEKGIYPKT